MIFIKELSNKTVDDYIFVVINTSAQFIYEPCWVHVYHFCKSIFFKCMSKTSEKDVKEQKKKIETWKVFV